MRVAMLLACAVAVWGFCGAIMGVGRAVTTLETTLVLHLLGAPLGAAVMAWIFHRFVGGFTPLAVAGSFVGVSLFLDLVLVAPVFEGSFEMFRSVIGLWLPQVLIFTAAWLAGNVALKPLVRLVRFTADSHARNAKDTIHGGNVAKNIVRY